MKPNRVRLNAAWHEMRPQPPHLSRQHLTRRVTPAITLIQKNSLWRWSIWFSLKNNSYLHFDIDDLSCVSGGLVFFLFWISFVLRRSFFDDASAPTSSFLWNILSPCLLFVLIMLRGEGESMVTAQPWVWFTRQNPLSMRSRDASCLRLTITWTQ